MERWFFLALELILKHVFGFLRNRRFNKKDFWWILKALQGAKWARSWTWTPGMDMETDMDMDTGMDMNIDMHMHMHLHIHMGMDMYTYVNNMENCRRTCRLKANLPRENFARFLQDT